MIAAMTLLPALLTLKSRQTGNRRPGI